jgi:hypothetical protein
MLKTIVDSRSRSRLCLASICIAVCLAACAEGDSGRDGADGSGETPGATATPKGEDGTPATTPAVSVGTPGALNGPGPLRARLDAARDGRRHPPSGYHLRGRNRPRSCRRLLRGRAGVCVERRREFRDAPVHRAGSRPRSVRSRRECRGGWQGKARGRRLGRLTTTPDLRSPRALSRSDRDPTTRTLAATPSPFDVPYARIGHDLGCPAAVSPAFDSQRA